MRQLVVELPCEKQRQSGRGVKFGLENLPRYSSRVRHSKMKLIGILKSLYIEPRAIKPITNA